MSSLPLQDTPNLYGRLSRLAHWGGALLVITMLAVGITFDEAPRGSEFRASMKALHISLGASVWLLLVGRILWRVKQNRAGLSPRPLSTVGWQLLLERGVHIGLLLALTALLCSGPLIVWTGGKPINIFGLLQLASPLTENKGLHTALEEGHELMANLLFGLLVLHIAGALRHGLGSLRRISGPVRG
ncbi:cytochrome b [Leptothrix ochracea]|uniref:cytochrome b n=1 Tax=Leptothrix ochracea TaxID=735331 RepID=UPI0034E2A776